MHKHIIELSNCNIFYMTNNHLVHSSTPPVRGDNRFFMTKIILLVAILSLGLISSSLYSTTTASVLAKTFQDLAEHDATLQYF